MMSLSTKLSRLIVKSQIRSAKFASLFCCLLLLLLGTIHSIFMTIYAKQISKILISDAASAKYIEKNIKILALFVPLICLQGGVFGTLRAIDGQKAFLGAQLVCNYGVHFGSMGVFLWGMGMDSAAMWWARLCSLSCLNVVGVVVIWRTDWEEKGRVIKRSM